MNWLDLLRAFILCTAATLFYALLLKTPPKAIICAPLIGGASYIIYLLLENAVGTTMSYFIATLFIAVVGEILARILHMPSTVFIIPGIIPLVPGYGLYRTMLLLVQNDLEGSAMTGAQTFFSAGAMAVAIAITNFIARSFFPKRHTKR